jgi:uncharacterized protein (TIGR00290 family)
LIPPKALFCWSGGKDSSYCLYKVLKEREYDVRYLLTTVNDTVKRVSMHGIREELADVQAKSLGIPLIKVRLGQASYEEYEEQMDAALEKAKAEGIDHVIFGDIFLEDIKAYREKNLKKKGMAAVFPLWKKNTGALLSEFVQLGFKTIICCVNEACLDKSWVGKILDADTIRELPAHIDPCGENGEYHTFCYEGPLFKEKIQFTTGEKVYKSLEVPAESSATSRFWFIDLIPALPEKERAAQQNNKNSTDLINF